MQTVLEEAGKTFLKAFLAALLVAAIGISAQPNLDRLPALGWAALAAALIAGIKAIQLYVPQLTFVAYLGDTWGKLVDAFARAFVGVLLVVLIGILGAPDLNTAKSLAVAGIAAAINAGLTALQDFLTKGQWPQQSFGIREPDPGRPKELYVSRSAAALGKH